MSKKIIDTVQTALAFIQFINSVSPASLNNTGDPVSVTEIAQKLQVSPKDVVACIHMLNYECGDILPEMFIEYDEKTQLITPRRIAYSLDRPLRLTSFEAHGLLNALSIAGYAQSEIYQTIAGALPRLDADTLKPMVRANTNKAISATLKTLAHAIRIQHAVHIAYKKGGAKQASVRDIEPYETFFDSSTGAWLVTAWCKNSLAWRMFRVDRIESCSMLDTPSCYKETVFLDTPKTAILLIHNPSAIQDAYDWRSLHLLHYSDEELENLLPQEEIHNGAYFASILWYPASIWLPQMILRTGGYVEAVAPKDLRAAVYNLGLRALSMLDG